MIQIPHLRMPTTRDAKEALIYTSLMALGVAFEVASKYNKDLRAEVADWQDGLTFSMGIWPDGPFMTVRKEGKDRVKYLGMGKKEVDVSILFKNLDGALITFMGLIGTHHAAAQRRFITYGNVGEAIKIARSMAIVQAMMFPSALINMTAKRPLRLRPHQLIAKARVLSALPRNLVWNIRR